MEVPDLGQDLKWNKLLREKIKSKMKKQKLPKNQINSEVEKQVIKMREITHFRR
ncbi:hypothetical protein D3C86_1850500 [compost metagenome]